MALPAKDKNFAQFQDDDNSCRQYASAQIGNASPGGAANQSGWSSATLGTILGAVAGVVIGAATGDPAAGAAIGAGSGLLVGGAAGLDAAQASAGGLQRRYDMSYMQCMYSKGNSVPTVAGAAAGGYYPYYGSYYGAYPYYGSYYYPPYTYYGPTTSFSAGFVSSSGGHGHWHH